MNIPLPDLRFEQTFMKQLYGYAAEAKPSKPAQLSDSDIALINMELDELYPTIPLPQITVPIVVYAVIKDQIILPLIQGFLWSGFLLSVAPVLSWVVVRGQGSGMWVANLIGLGVSSAKRA